MKEASGDLWKIGANADAIVITTNGTVKKNGEAVMGRGCAQEAAVRFPDLPKFLGKRLVVFNDVKVFSFGNWTLVTYPVKHEWWQKADMGLIAKSALELVFFAEKHEWENVVMPRPGCGNGGLSWWAVRPILEEVLDDRFTAVTYE